MQQIEPKPTQYGNLLFRSRLEARWAVFLDNHPAVRSWTYEPYTLRLPRQKWEYTPDFDIRIGSRDACLLLEVKPAPITEEYRFVLESFSRFLLAPKRIPLYVIYGDFYAGTFTVAPIGQTPHPSFHQIFPRSQAAIKAAAEYRFDIRS